MNDFDSINPMNAYPSGQGGGSGSSGVPPSGPVDPTPPPINPISPQGPMSEKTNFSRIYQIIIGAVALFLIISLIFAAIYYQKANKTQAYINSVASQAADQKAKDDKVSCDAQIKDIKENPWTEYTARQEFGAFKFIVPRNWSQYEYYDINANDPYSLFFSPDTVRYVSNTRDNHSALQVVVSKRLYSDEISDLEQSIKMNMDTSSSEEKVTISNFTGTKFVYTNKDLQRKVGVIVLPYRDRALMIKTDDYDKWGDKYFTKFYQSFALTP